MKRKFNDITAFIVAMIAMFMSASCDVKQISGDTPLGVEAESAQLKGSFKLLSWNIQDGMWCDQFNNYDEFVAYVNGFAPDIFCIQEGATHWDVDGKNLAYNQRTLPYAGAADPSGQTSPTGWIELAKRWGHDYVVMGPYKDNYPVVITSRYPLELIQRMAGNAETEVSHGAVHVKVTPVEGCEINLVNLHLKPNVPDNQENYRLSEINYYLSQTINSQEHYQEPNWLMVGDFNDKADGKVDTEIRKNSYYDLWAEMNNYTGSYIDYIFGTKSMRMSLKSIGFQYGFARTEKLETSVNGVELNSGKGLWKYSDHYPILAEFAIYE